MGKYKEKNNRKRNPIYAYGNKFSKVCKCEIPKPKGWSMRNGKSYADCECGGEYRTTLSETAFS